MMLRQFSINRLIVLFVAFAFLFLSIDSLIEHWSILTREIGAIIPVVFALLGAMLGFYAFITWNDPLIRTFQFYLLISFLVSAGGLYFHLEDNDENERRTEKTISGVQQKTEKPLLAPLAFAGVASFGLLRTIRKWKADVINSSYRG